MWTEIGSRTDSRQYMMIITFFSSLCCYYILCTYKYRGDIAATEVNNPVITHPV